MSRLLRTNFSRMWKSKVFWLCGGFLFGFALYQVISQYIFGVRYHEIVYLDESIFAVAVVGIFAQAVFTSLFFGVEYSEGTMRNKLMVGHTRCSIYMANLITSISAGIIFVTVWLIPYATLGAVLMERENSWLMILMFFFTILFEISVFSAIFVFIMMLCSSRAISSVICLILSLVIICVGNIVESRLEEPETVSPYELATDGRLVESEPQKNPRYLPEGSGKRVAFEFLSDYLPGNQGLKLARVQCDKMEHFIGYDLVNIALLSGVGYFLYKRKDLK